MRGFWRLYRKELRFLVWPGIGLILILISSTLFVSVIHNIAPSYYSINILMKPKNPSLFVKYIVQPILFGPNVALDYSFAVLFLYAVFHEHISRSRYQLFMLPTQQMAHLWAKICAAFTWSVLALCSVYIFTGIMLIAGTLIPPLAVLQIQINASPEVIILGVLRSSRETLLIGALAVLGYVAGTTGQRLQLLVGVATAVLGFVISKWISLSFLKLTLHMFPRQPGVPVLYQVYSWSTIMVVSLMVTGLLAASVMLYNRCGEI